MEKRFGLFKRIRNKSKGNGTLIVVVNSVGSYWDYSIVDETILVSLEHFGIPYRVVDLYCECLSAEILSDCAGIILAQARLGSFLTAEENSLIADAVKEGTGLVSFDNDIRLYKGSYLEMFGFEKINPHPYASNIMRIRNNNHYISQMQYEGEYHNFDRMVTAVAVEKWREDVTPIAECILGKEQLVYIRHLTPWSAFEPRNYPVVFATRWGKGKAVQFTLSPRVWRNEFYGHAKGIDDLFWRSIIWAVRKPFVANMTPPFVTLSFDDCSGRHDFKYADIAVSHGYVPMPSLLLNNISERLFPKVREGLESGQIEYNTHALDYYNHLYYEYGKGEHSTEKLKKIFSSEDEWWHRIGVMPGTTVRFHLGEMGVNSLQFLKKRGRLFLNPALQTGLLKSDMCMSDGFWPYNLQNFYYDYLPDDHDFYVYNSMQKRFQEDFLTGCTVTLRESENNDIEKAGRNLAKQIQLGLRSGLYSEIVTHEQKLEGVSLDEWDRILTRGAQLTQKVDKIFAGHDHIGKYLKSKDEAWIRESCIDRDVVKFTLSGKTDTALEVSVFKDNGNMVEREYCIVETFEEEAKTVF